MCQAFSFDDRIWGPLSGYVRRWFKIGIDEAGGYFDASWGAWNDSIVAMSMPHKETLLEVLNNAVNERIFVLYTGDGDPGRCSGTTNPGDDFHVWTPYDPINVIATYAGELRSLFLQGFPDKNGGNAPPIVLQSNQPPLYPDGRESPN